MAKATRSTTIFLSVLLLGQISGAGLARAAECPQGYQKLDDISCINARGDKRIAFIKNGWYRIPYDWMAHTSNGMTGVEEEGIRQGATIPMTLYVPTEIVERVSGNRSLPGAPEAKLPASWLPDDVATGAVSQETVSRYYVDREPTPPAPKITIIESCPEHYHREANTLNCIDRNGDRVAFDAETGAMGKVISKSAGGLEGYELEFKIAKNGMPATERRWFPLNKLAVPGPAYAPVQPVVRLCPAGYTKMTARLCRDRSGVEVLLTNYNGQLYQIHGSNNDSFLVSNLRHGPSEQFWVKKYLMSTVVSPSPGIPHGLASQTLDHGRLVPGE